MALYAEIADDLRARIAAGEWRSGKRIDSMPQLMAHYGVSSMNTIRQAQKRLIDEGVLRSAQGVGVFVAATPKEHWTQPVSVRDELFAIQQAATRAISQVPELSPDAMHIVRRLVAAWEAFIEAVRSDEGLRADLLDALTAALQDLAEAWRDAETLPRSAVQVLVQLVPQTQHAADAYADPTRQDLYDASFVLQELVAGCCASTTVDEATPAEDL